MATFRVGQRVRLIRVINHPDKIGKEGVITDRHISPAGCGWCVQLDGDTRANGWAEEWQLEPITDRNTKVEWSECAWSPHGVEA